jgi:conjugal transfer pilus assembly protein TraB
MAEGLFPVIEVDAGRQIDVIVTKGAKLQIRSTSTRGRDKK